MKGLFTFNSFFKISLVLILASFGFNNSAFADNTRWRGPATGGDWELAANWNNGLPSAALEAVFDVSASININDDTTIERMQVWTGNTVTLIIAETKTLTVSGSFFGILKIFKNANLTIAGTGTLDISNPGSTLIQFRTVNNTTDVSGSLNISAGATVKLTGNTGFSSINNSTTATTGEVNNSGTLDLTGIATGNGFNLSSNAQLILNNNKCGLINLGANAKIKTFKTAAPFSVITNNGLIIFDGVSVVQGDGLGGSGISLNGTGPGVGNQAINNGFWDYADGDSFASGNNAVITDNGMDISSTVTKNAGGSCIVDFTTATAGMEVYSWALGGSTTANNMPDGTIDFTGANFSTNAGAITIADSPCFSLPNTVAAFNLCQEAILPVELLSFSARKKDNDVALEWSTSIEVNNDFFTIERSTDGRNFTAIGKVAGAGDSDSVIEYNFMDEKPAIGKNYYRLKQTDFDGAYEYFNIELVDFKGNSNVSVYPNPVTNHLTVKALDANNVTVQIFNLTGQLVRLSNQEVIDLSDLAKGSYFLLVTDNDTQAVLFQDKLIKQ